jgi:hypothetical protein
MGCNCCLGGNLTALSGLDGKNQWTNIVQTRAADNDVMYGSHGQVFETRKEVLLNMDENLGMMGVRYKNWKYLNGNGTIFKNINLYDLIFSKIVIGHWTEKSSKYKL